ncbi:MAG: hypothetical protein HFJ10_08770 [Lachnospiraceae bacterium]|jgi:hypothetical protein|nr:hypothetical protein [Lachnospiraceae bacterium]
MEKSTIDETRKKQVQGLTIKVMIGITVIVLLYVAYTFITKDVNMLVFQILLSIFVISYTFLADVVEPYRLGMLNDMTIGQRTGFMKMMVADVVGVGALLYWIIGMGSDTNRDILLPLLIYFFASQMKRKFRPEFEGITEEEEEAEEKAEE